MKSISAIILLPLMLIFVAWTQTPQITLNAADYKVLLAGKSTGEISLTSLENIKALTLTELNAKDGEVPTAQIVSFTIYFSPKKTGKTLYMETIKGQEFTNSTLKQFKTLEPQDIIIISDISILPQNSNVSINYPDKLKLTVSP